MKARGGIPVRVVVALAAIAVSIPVAVTAHGDPPPPPTTTSSSPATSPLDTSTASVTVHDPQGSGCGAYTQQVPSGKGSVAGIAAETLSDAIASSPVLTNFNAAITGQFNPKVNLVDAVNAPGGHIVFAPTDDAFAKLPPAQLSALKADPVALAANLNYLVVLGTLGPDDVHGRLTTLLGKQITVQGKGDDITVDTAKVTCGGLYATNGVIYMIDTVLDPNGALQAPPTSGTSTTSETSTSTSSTTTTSASETGVTTTTAAPGH